MDSYTDFVIHYRILFVVVSKWSYILKAGSNTIIGAIAVTTIIWFVATIPFDMMFTIVEQGDNIGPQQQNILDTISRYWNIGPQILILSL